MVAVGKQYTMYTKHISERKMLSRDSGNACNSFNSLNLTRQVFSTSILTRSIPLVSYRYISYIIYSEI